MSDSTITDKKKTPAEKAVAARPPFDGPHRKIKKTVEEGDKTTEPAYVVTVTKKKEDPDAGPNSAPRKYDPQELRTKARSLLLNKNVSPEQRKVLAEILGPEAEDKDRNKEPST